jgi:hypothetical protein
MEISDRLGEMLVGALSEEERTNVGAHLQDCASCARELEELRTLEDRLRRLPALEARRPKRRLRAWGPLLAAGVFLLFVTVILTRREGDQSPGAPQGVGRKEDVKASARHLLPRFEALGKLLREIDRGPARDGKALKRSVEALQADTDLLERGVPADAKELRERVRTMRQAYRVVEMLLWEPPDHAKFEAALKEFDPEDQRRISAVYLAGLSPAPSEMMTLSKDFFRRGRDAAADLADEPLPVVSISLTVTNYMRKEDQRIWNTGRWEIMRPGGSKRGIVRFTLGDRPWFGEIQDRVLRSLLADLKEDDLLILRDGSTCRCDAPQFKLTVSVDGVKNEFTFAHAHEEKDRAQQEVVEAIIKFTERRATTPVEK